MTRRLPLLIEAPGRRRARRARSCVRGARRRRDSGTRRRAASRSRTSQKFRLLWGREFARRRPAALPQRRRVLWRLVRRPYSEGRAADGFFSRVVFGGAGAAARRFDSGVTRVVFSLCSGYLTRDFAPVRRRGFFVGPVYIAKNKANPLTAKDTPGKYWWP